MPNPHHPSPSPAPLPAPPYQLAAAPEPSYAYDDEPSTPALSDGVVSIGHSVTGLCRWWWGRDDRRITRVKVRRGGRSGRSAPLRSPYCDSLDTAEDLGLCQHPAVAVTSPYRLPSPLPTPMWQRRR
ncbi:hypothetical protein FIBSPDRAFT_855086 [Athelia psychrophila]|uniref:Uncharacterized protein n=1 Tax=Athelia psychrophila TaxID=1759441 RepID=A0A166PIN4_9AGAM|nr:hypothetical protein FIBSPDRAFT_855086 [Fibularhizoctonia sp. CBS 109695]